MCNEYFKKKRKIKTKYPLGQNETKKKKKNDGPRKDKYTARTTGNVHSFRWNPNHGYGSIIITMTH